MDDASQVSSSPETARPGKAVSPPFLVQVRGIRKKTRRESADGRRDKKEERFPWLRLAFVPARKSFPFCLSGSTLRPDGPKFYEMCPKRYCVNFKVMMEDFDMNFLGFFPHLVWNEIRANPMHALKDCNRKDLEDAVNPSIMYRFCTVLVSYKVTISAAVQNCR